MTWLSEKDFRYHDDESAVAQYRSEVTSPQTNDSSASVTSFDCYVNVDGEDDRYVADLCAADETLEHMVLNAEFTKL